MPNRYRDTYPSEAQITSDDALPLRAADAIRLDYFQAEPDTMPTVAYAEHHILISLSDRPVDTENVRNGKTLRYGFDKDEVVITPAGVESGWRWYQRSHVAVVLLDTDEIERFAKRHLGVLLSEQQLRDVPRTQDSDLVETAKLLIDALKERRTGFEVLYEAHSRIFLVKLLDRYGERLADHVFDEDFSAQHYKRVLDYIEARFGETLTVEDLAAAAGLSATAFSREFKRVVGETPYRFLMTYRVERAQEKLADTTEAMIEIALSCGFSDQAHFSRTFKSVVGQTPREYRK
ncbi:MAG: helix-turn-helix domain-containing protein, partial [Pseudomonadota bacterium]